MLPLQSKVNKVFLILACLFVANALLAEIIGIKIFSVEKLFGVEPLNMQLFGATDISISMTTGVLIWPVVFILTDIINEYFGLKGVRFLSYLTVGIILFSFFIIFIAIQVPPNSWWQHESGMLGGQKGIPDMQNAFSKIFGQGLWIIIASIIAFLIGQLIDVLVFQRSKRLTGEKYLWFRVNASTFVSQLIDSFLILFIAFYIGAGWEMSRVLAIGTVNFFYKFGVSLILTPLVYFIHILIDNYLGKKESLELRKKALQNV